MPSVDCWESRVVPSSSPVVDYLDALESALGFDRALARRVRREAEDHLWEFVSARAADGISVNATNERALAGFGKPQEIARAYAASSLFRQTRRLSLTAILVPAGIFAAMWLRVALGGVPLGFSGDIERIRAMALAVYVWSFRATLAIGAVLLAYTLLRRLVPVAFHERYGAELRRYLLLCAVGTGGAVLSALADAVLVGTRLWAAASFGTVIPVLSVLAELAFSAALFLHLRAAIRRKASVTSLVRAGG